VVGLAAHRRAIGMYFARASMLGQRRQMVPKSVFRRLRGVLHRGCSRGPQFLAGMILALAFVSNFAFAQSETISGARPRNGDRVRVFLLDERGQVLEPGQAYASISRGLPGGLAKSTGHLSETLDAQSLRFVLCARASEIPKRVSLQSSRRNGDKLDAINDIKTTSVHAPSAAAPNVTCVETPLIRVAPDVLDANAPGLRSRSVEGEIGGVLELNDALGNLATLTILGPREPEFARAPYLAKLRVRVVRSVAGGPPPMGRDDSEALAVMQQEVRVASQLWSQCGIYFGDETKLDFALVDPPEPFMVAVGCDFGLPASGGQIRLRVGNRDLTVPTRRKESPRVVALHLAQAAEKLGLVADIEKNPLTLAGALPTFDVTFRNRAGQYVPLGVGPDQRVSNDATLGVCVGDVDLEDGLDHFTNVDSMTGTLEERSLLRAVVDRDPLTIDVVVVESFSRIGRIGESFVSSEGGNLGNLILLNRAGLREGGRSFALAHELGHILLDSAGHPDDYGVDTPWSLMDSDAVDGTIFGPRHLTLDDCRRALRQSGPAAPAPLLQPH